MYLPREQFTARSATHTFEDLDFAELQMSDTLVQIQDLAQRPRRQLCESVNRSRLSTKSVSFSRRQAIST